MGLARHAPLAASSRLPAAERLGASPAAEILVLALLGAGAAVLSAAVDLDLKVPGHAILKCVLPLSLGYALVPRAHAGSVMGSAALAVVLVQGPIRGGQGWGAAASLVMAGPILDALLRRAATPRGIHLAFLAGGALANLLAFGVRLVAKLVFHDGGRPLASWWPEAILTYALCGLLAGLLSSALWFRFSPARP